MKLAVIKTGGKQYVVSEGSVVTLEKLPEAKIDGSVQFETLLTDSGTEAVVGTPAVSSKVTGIVVTEGKGKKLTIVKYKAKSRYFKKRGHRQPFTRVKIESI